LTQRDLEKSKIALASYGRPFLHKLSSCYRVLHFPIVPCHGSTTKSGGTVKKFRRFGPDLCPHFWNASGAIERKLTASASAALWLFPSGYTSSTKTRLLYIMGDRNSLPQPLMQ